MKEVEGHLMSWADLWLEPTRIWVHVQTIFWPSGSLTTGIGDSLLFWHTAGSPTAWAQVNRCSAWKSPSASHETPLCVEIKQFHDS